MRVKIKRVDAAALGAVIVGCVMLAIAGVFYLKGDSSDSKNPFEHPGSSASGKYQSDSEGIQNPKPTQRPNGNGSLPGFQQPGVSKDPFAKAIGDSSMHKVTITFTSDGPMYLGYRYRSGKTGVRVANHSFSSTKNERGPLPVVELAVRVIGTSTYAKCSITIDGTEVESQTAKGSGHITVCLS